MTSDGERDLLSLLSRIVERLDQIAAALLDDAPRNPKLQRLAELERELAHLDGGDRARAIQERLGLSRSAYYRQRARLAVPENPTQSR